MSRGETLTIKKNGMVFRWSGGSFIAVWKASREAMRVPDDMIAFPDTLVKSRSGHKEIHTIACGYLGITEEEE